MSINFVKKNTFKLIIVSLFLSLLSFQTVSAASVLDIVANYPIYIAVENEVLNSPLEYTALTPTYHLINERLVKGKTYSVEISYSKQDNNYKKVLFFDKTQKVWKPLPTVDNPKANKVKVEIPFDSVHLAVFSNNEILTVGKASWYSYKNGLFAASPDFAKGSILRVYNLANGKFVDVTINDYGPERATHPDRVVDLDKVAFKKIAATSVGTIDVKIEVLKAVNKDLNKELKVATEPNISAWSAVVMRESDEKVLWSKNGEKVSPLASLTKIVAAQVFLDTNPTLSNVVTYLKQDEDYNYKYCKPGESAKLTVKEGETMTLENLLYSALVGSANNAVESLVRNSGLTRDEFIVNMNAKVKKWGATSTSFVEPTGLSENNMSSPLDYAIITKEAFINPLIKEISTTYKYSFSTINTKQKHNLTNTNQLISGNKYDIIGSKTGYLNEARYCLMTRIKTILGNLIVVNFGSDSKANNFSDNEKLINYGLQLLKK